MKLGIISGSHRENSESARVAEYIQAEVKRTQNESYLFCLAKNPLPLWDEGVWSGAPIWTEKWKPVATELQSCDGFVIVTPEWGGMVPSGLKNFFLLCGVKELGHKPGLIVAVSSGLGGSYPVVELRHSSYKNNRLCYLPEHIIVRNCETMLKGETPSDEHDESLRKRVANSVKLLTEYAQALKSVRENNEWDYKSFPYGM